MGMGKCDFRLKNFDDLLHICELTENGFLGLTERVRVVTSISSTFIPTSMYPPALKLFIAMSPSIKSGFALTSLP